MSAIKELSGVYFESFTASAGRAMDRADRLAKGQNALFVEPLDLLAALAAESESRASELLLELGVEMDRLWAGLGPGIATSDGTCGMRSSKPASQRTRHCRSRCPSRPRCGRS